MPNAATSGLPHPASYTDLGNGAVLDNVTCLTWQKTESPADTITNNQAYCDALNTSSSAGYTDWRMPTRVEIASIVDRTRTNTAINPIFTKEASGYDRTFSLWYETIAGIKNSTFGWVYNMGSGLTSNAYAQTRPGHRSMCARQRRGRNAYGAGRGAPESLHDQ